MEKEACTPRARVDGSLPLAFGVRFPQRISPAAAGSFLLLACNRPP